ncbi:MAG TPA: VOC family protein [Dehalococcoidia bacterium]
MLPIKRIDHVSMAVPDLAKQIKFFEDLFGMKQGEHYDRPEDGYDGLEMSIPGSDTKFELLSPAGDPGLSFVSKFLARPGSMYHHVTFEVTDIREAARVLREYGIEPFGYREEAEWAKELFIHPRDTGGVLIQLFEPHPDAT